MAELFNHGETEIFDPRSHIGFRGDIIIPISVKGSTETAEAFIALSPLEAKELIDSLSASLKEYREALSDAA